MKRILLMGLLVCALPCLRGATIPITTAQGNPNG
jgi:hypothetical protein